MPTSAAIAPFTYLPMYMQLLAMTKKNCITTPGSDSTLSGVCTDLSAGVAKFRSELDGVKGILPTTAQMAELQDIAWMFPSTNDTTMASKQVIQLLLDVAAKTTKPLDQDNDVGSIFSEDRISVLEKDLNRDVLPDISRFDQADLLMQTLIQARMTRLEGIGFYTWSKVMMVVITLPQLLILAFIMIQFGILKRREHRMRKNTLKISRERSLMQSLLSEMRAGQNYQEERPAAVVAHL